MKVKEDKIRLLLDLLCVGISFILFWLVCISPRLNKEGNKENASITAFIAADTEVRSVPNETAGGVVKKLAKGAKITLLEECGDWYRVSNGFVKKRKVSLQFEVSLPKKEWGDLEERFIISTPSALAEGGETGVSLVLREEVSETLEVSETEATIESFSDLAAQGVKV